MLQVEEYIEKLNEVLRQIKNYFDVAKMHESGVASFIFCEKGIRSIEIYQSEDSIVIEFWMNEELQTEKEVNSYEKAAKLAVEWVNKYEN